MPQDLQISNMEISSLQSLQSDESKLQRISNPMNKYFDVNSASVRVMFNPECFFPSLFPNVVLRFGFLFRDVFFSKAVESELFFFFPSSWKKCFLSKETFKLSANSQGYRGIFCHKLPSKKRLAAALILRAAGFLGCGENEMVQLIEVMTEPR